MTFRIGQVSLDALRRAVQLATAAVNSHLLSPIAPTAPTTPPQPTSYPPLTQQSAPHTNTHKQAAAAQAIQQHPYLIKNLCPISFVFGQTGTAEVLSLSAHSEVGCHWHTPPGFTTTAERTLRLACTATVRAVDPDAQHQYAPHAAEDTASAQWAFTKQPTSPQSPLQHPSGPLQHPSDLLQHPSDNPQAADISNDNPALSHAKHPMLGKHSMLVDRQLEGSPTGLPWGAPFDCTVTGSHQQQLLLPDGAYTWVAVSVQKVGLQWQICLQPEYIVCNQLAGEVQLHYTGQLAGLADARSGAMLSVEPDVKVCSPAMYSCLSNAICSAWLCQLHVSLTTNPVPCVAGLNTSRHMRLPSCPSLDT